MSVRTTICNLTQADCICNEYFHDFMNISCIIIHVPNSLTFGPFRMNAHLVEYYTCRHYEPHRISRIVGSNACKGFHCKRACCSLSALTPGLRGNGHRVWMDTPHPIFPQFSDLSQHQKPRRPASLGAATQPEIAANVQKDACLCPSFSLYYQ